MSKEHQLPRKHPPFAGWVSRGDTQAERDEWYWKNKEEGERVMRERIEAQKRMGR